MYLKSTFKKLFNGLNNLWDVKRPVRKDAYFEKWNPAAGNGPYLSQHNRRISAYVVYIHFIQLLSSLRNTRKLT